MNFDVYILGSSSATPIYQRHPTAQYLSIHQHCFLLDCGEGTLIQLNRYRIKFHRINHIFISHLHGDHFLGLMGLISTMHLQGRTNELHLYAPAELKEIIDIQLHHSQTTLRFALVYHPTNPRREEIIYEDDILAVKSIPLSHRIACTGFIFSEKPLPRKLIKEQLINYQVPVEYFSELKEGKDFTATTGEVIPNNILTTEPRRSRSYAYCSDTIFDPGLSNKLKSVDLLYHEATFLHNKLDRARETFHTTALQAAQIAKQSAVKKLIIGHFSARYKNLYPLLEEAKSVFPNTSLALEGDRFSVEA